MELLECNDVMPHVHKSSLTDTSSETTQSAKVPKNLSVTAKYVLNKCSFFQYVRYSMH